ncbi:hypothetical protein EJ05DRAFT_484845 [Pseudovirgaria hyperparasitica]|uniref:Glutamine repeat protein-1 n=1 Tax=Pseudovirgaria hyperparasitica TaxID=470096 RepID=A0A6A6WBL6_9PEZI|nr:uncharacterized protein EJ05DRAFT_484845 [Pseudovirgaria hyperparasitica]KAF2759965.1 hypothetical protein EJ05DRAFT_484845 [Pseudovirgaria hyperparasitica]
MDYNHHSAANQPHPTLQNQQHPYQYHGAQHAMGNAGPSPSMHQQGQMPRGGPQQFYQQNLPYSQGHPHTQISPTAPGAPAQKFAQNIGLQTSSPQTHASIYSTTPQTSQPPLPPPPPPQSDSNQPSPMAAPTSTQPLAQQGAPVQTRPVPQSPITPEGQAKERERMTLLLDINSELLQELSILQSQGKGGAGGGTDGPVGPGGGMKPDGQQQASKDYLELLRRLQSNLAYQASTAERYGGKVGQVQPGPAIMTAPASPPALKEMYARLQALFPGWKGSQTVKNSPGPQQRQNLPQGHGAGPPTAPGMQ